MILRIALDTPLRRLFDYRPPVPAEVSSSEGLGTAPWRPGVRVRVPFGRRRLIGILVAMADRSLVPEAKLKAAIEILDAEPIFDPVTLGLLEWAADYYQHPIGEVFAAALPAAVRQGQTARELTRYWSPTEAGRAALAPATAWRSLRQRALLAWLEARGRATDDEIAVDFKTPHRKALAERGLIAAESVAPEPDSGAARPSDVTLNGPQAATVEAVLAARAAFAVHLIDGVTGSGKTEVYLRVIAACIADGSQALVLVPEIALTPQLVERFRGRFGAGVVALHSALAGSERRDAWRSARDGTARIVIGTRSAVFTSLPRLSLIVVDEEHDASYKQHEGFHYSARDLAVVRAHAAGVPVLLGSATPSLETLENAAAGRYVRHVLPERPGAARPPALSLIDLRRHAAEQGISSPAIQAISRHLGAGAQVIVFLNRRGYAPSLFCSACGWVAPCEHCDARMTLHARARALRCHHCGARAPIPAACAVCAQPLQPVGQGTERIEETLTRLFPDAPLARLDRDVAQARGSVAAVLTRMASGEAKILVGTQMLAKGHHFPDVTLVVVLDADQGLFASDFRATERLAQTITQVAGRAGRASRPGEVLIQTQFPEHPLLNRLIADGYGGFAAAALDERREAGWPPYTRLALLRAEAKDAARLDRYLREAAELGLPLATGVKILGPAPALIARRADHFRAHLLIESKSRAPLQRFLRGWIPRIEQLAGPSGLRWSIDVDPLQVE